MQSVSSRIWTRVAVSISYDDNDYTTGTSQNDDDDDDDDDINSKNRKWWWTYKFYEQEVTRYGAKSLTLAALNLLLIYILISR